MGDNSRLQRWNRNITKSMTNNKSNRMRWEKMTAVMTKYPSTNVYFPPKANYEKIYYKDTKT